jgi:hypothetical protein
MFGCAAAHRNLRRFARFGIWSGVNGATSEARIRCSARLGTLSVGRTCSAELAHCLLRCEVRYLCATVTVHRAPGAAEPDTGF